MINYIESPYVSIASNSKFFKECFTEYVLESSYSFVGLIESVRLFVHF